MNITNTASKEVYAQIGNGLALLRICKLASGGNAILYTTDATNLSLNGKALVVCNLYELGRTIKVCLDILLV